jgi:tetratricopeptide (TPR) repeat protein
MQKFRDAADTRLCIRAETAYDKALALEPRQVEAMVGLAWVHNTEHEFAEGRRWAEKALALNPGLPNAHALIGDGAIELGDYDAAFKHYQAALDLRPDLSSYSRAAHLLWLTGDSRKAQWLMQKAIDAGGPHAENTAWCRAELALMSFQMGALLVAERQTDQALQQAPKNPHVLAMMGRIKMAKKEYAEALDFYRRAAAIATTHDVLVALGDLQALTGHRDEAEKQYERVIALHTAGAAHSHGGDVHAHPAEQGNAQLARFYADHDRNLDEALAQAEKACEVYKNVFVTDTLAWCYYKKERYDQASKTMAQALRWKTPDPSLMFHAGMIQAKLGDRQAAKMYLYRALNMNPQFHPLNAEIAAETLKDLSQSPPQTQIKSPNPGAGKPRQGKSEPGGEDEPVKARDDTDSQAGS